MPHNKVRQQGGLDYIMDEAAYGWVILEDHLFEGQPDEYSEIGTMGPSDAPSTIQMRLAQGDGDFFQIHDDDRNLYFVGRAVAEDWTEAVCFAPLQDFGKAFGAVSVTWPGHPERDCG